jgi:hypothetical protein
MHITPEQLAKDIARAMIADILETWSHDEIKLLVEKLSAKPRKLN